MEFRVSPSTMYDTDNEKVIDGYKLTVAGKDGADVYYISDDETYQLLSEIIWAIRNKNSSSNENR